MQEAAAGTADALVTSLKKKARKGVRDACSVKSRFCLLWHGCTATVGRR